MDCAGSAGAVFVSSRSGEAASSVSLDSVVTASSSTGLAEGCEVFSAAGRDAAWAAAIAADA
ncbi:hypothetical protein BKH30_01875 [Actinomyces oris]|uniref:Uncharacterized protein n=1 Tax=Actinomyces oris TaxID=544580 RepID=A0A1Q8W3L3_9ACTO|nr:hypothetical protein BKH30_01875 [Actinomyces oris]